MPKYLRSFVQKIPKLTLFNVQFIIYDNEFPKQLVVAVDAVNPS